MSAHEFRTVLEHPCSLTRPFAAHFHEVCKQTKHLTKDQMSRVMRKPTFCICENKDADQLRGNREADQRLCFCYTNSTIPLLPKSKFSSLQPSSVVVQPGLCGTWAETLQTGFLITRLKCLASMDGCASGTCL